MQFVDTAVFESVVTEAVPDRQVRLILAIIDILVKAIADDFAMYGQTIEIKMNSRGARLEPS